MEIVIIGLLILNLIILLYVLSKLKKKDDNNIERLIKEEREILIKYMAEETRNSRLEFSQTVRLAMDSQNNVISNSSVENEKKLEQIRTSIESRLQQIQSDNQIQLEKMRETVDEKLQKTLESRISESFKQVSERLEQVYKGLGEMQSLANGVGDLKKVLSNVKTRGVLGEVQLGAILEQILAPEQYEANVITKKGSSSFVEFAIKLPGDIQPIYLPIDAKFPADAYTNLIDAYDKGDVAEIEQIKKVLATRIKNFAKDIQEKYIDPPNTTDFGIMFLPFEGLYSEVVRLGLIEELQNTYKINIAGPTTMAALLNSLQMGFRTLAIQKRSSEVWNVLGGVKTEFEKFSGVLMSAQKKLEATSSELDNLIGVRTRQIQRKLKDVQAIESTNVIDESE